MKYPPNTYRSVDEENRPKVMRADQCFKKLLMDVRVLAKTLNVFIKNLNSSPEDVFKMWDEGRIILMNSELVSSSNGRMTVDLLYKINTEKEGWVYLIIEGQLYRRPDDVYLKRAMSYISKVIDDQRGESHWKDYEDLRKVYCAWIVFDPRIDERNSVVRYSVQSMSEGCATNPILFDPMEIVVIGIGNPDEALTEETYALDMMFFDKIEEEKRMASLRELFKIDINDIIMGNVRWMHMSLDEEFIEHWKSVGIQEGIQKEKAEGRKNLIAYLSMITRKMMERTGATFDETARLLEIPQDVSDDVRREVLSH